MRRITLGTGATSHLPKSTSSVSESDTNHTVSANREEVRVKGKEGWKGEMSGEDKRVGDGRAGKKSRRE